MLPFPQLTVVPQSLYPGQAAEQGGLAEHDKCENTAETPKTQKTQSSMSVKKPTRREFLVAGSSAALAAAVPAANLDAAPPGNAAPSTETSDREPVPFSAAELFQPGPQRTFSGDRATQVAMPIGGLGAGCICVNGSGGLQDFSIRTRPETTALPAGFTSNSPEAAFAVLAYQGSGACHQARRGSVSAFQDFRPGIARAGVASRRIRGVSAV